MPIDRRRRDAIAALLLQHLPGKLPPRDCHDAIGVILEECPLFQRGSNMRQPRGFPVSPTGTQPPAAIEDHVLDSLFTNEFSTHLMCHSAGNKRQEQHWQALCRTVALLRSNLTEHDLGYPRRARTRSFATLLLWPTAVAASIATLICATLHAAFLLLWPAIGLLFLLRLKWFIQPAAREDPAAFPFLTIEQANAAALLIAPGEIPPFLQDRYPALPRDEKKPKNIPLWKRILLAPLMIFPLLLLLFIAVSMLTLGICLVIFWPFSIAYQCRRKRATPGPTQ